MASDKTRDLCYQYFRSEPDIRVRLEYCHILQSMLEDEAAELQRQLDGPKLPLMK